MITDTSTPALSVLDLVPVRTGQSSAQAVAASLALVQTADRLGFPRYWFAEHHNLPAEASTTPPVLAAAAAARTERIRVGSGGVMLPNHSPLVVAEQFAALEAIAPGRVDLGIGRAPGSDQVISQLLRMSGTTSDVERFPDHVRDIVSLVSAQGASVRLASGATYTVHATPAATSTPQVWLLGSSDYSAQLAAALGMPYVFANHFAGRGLEQALDLYRGAFRPSESLDAPRTFLTANAVASSTAEEAEARAVPQLRMMARLRLGKRLVPLETVEEASAARAAEGDHAAEQVMAATRESWFVGTGEDVAGDVMAFASRWGRRGGHALAGRSRPRRGAPGHRRRPCPHPGAPGRGAARPCRVAADPDPRIGVVPLLILALVAAALVVVVLGVASGRIRVDPLADAMHSVPDHGLPVIPDAADVDAVRFDTAPLGYDPRDVDAALDRLRDTLEEQEHRIATLREGSVD